MAELYRVLRNLSTGHVKGDIVDGSQYKALAALIAANALAPVSTPPLAELPGWTTRAEKLATIGIVTVQEFLDSDPQTIKELFGYKTVAGITRWRAEATDWLKPTAAKKRGK